jgi:hypothetical protein
MVMFIPNLPSNKTYFVMFFPLCTNMTAMWLSIVIRVIIGVGLREQQIFWQEKIQKKMYYFRYGARWMNCPKVKICLLSNNYCLISYNIKRFFVGGFPITFLVPLKVSTTRFSIRFKYVVTRFLVICFSFNYMGGFFPCICWMTTSKNF